VFFYYKVEAEEPEENHPCHCDCGWSGVYKDLQEVRSCCLTPGDPSPTGRCPDCNQLAYPSTPLWGSDEGGALTSPEGGRAEAQNLFALEEPPGDGKFPGGGSDSARAARDEEDLPGEVSIINQDQVPDHHRET
jgi:hypothetical protein